MSSSLVEAYEFGPFRLEPTERRLLRDGQFVPLPPKALDLLIALVSRPGRLVTRETLLEEVWSLVQFVEEANLSYTVSLLRKALDDGNGDARYIDTVPKGGYQFKADIRTVAADISGTKRNLSSPEHFVETTETRAVDTTSVTDCQDINRVVLEIRCPRAWRSGTGRSVAHGDSATDSRRTWPLDVAGQVRRDPPRAHPASPVRQPGDFSGWHWRSVR